MLCNLCTSLAAGAAYSHGVEMDSGMPKAQQIRRINCVRAGTLTQCIYYYSLVCCDLKRDLFSTCRKEKYRNNVRIVCCWNQLFLLLLIIKYYVVVVRPSCVSNQYTKVWRKLVWRLVCKLLLNVNIIKDGSSKTIVCWIHRQSVFLDYFCWKKRPWKESFTFAWKESFTFATNSVVHLLCLVKKWTNIRTSESHL